MSHNDLLAPQPLHLPADPAAGADLSAPATLIAHPNSPLAWATQAEQRLANAADDAGRLVAYAFARTGYHRSLDLLRANGWKGWGPIPLTHKHNEGVLRALAALAHAAQAIGEDDEYERLRTMLADADPAAIEQLLD